MLEGQDARVAPLRRALAVWGLTPDDIGTLKHWARSIISLTDTGRSGVVSIHGTSTQANEKNETAVYNDIFVNIGRTPGNAVPVMAQKSLTGVLFSGAT
jgi:fatty acid synthase subunit beta